MNAPLDSDCCQKGERRPPEENRLHDRVFLLALDQQPVTSKSVLSYSVTRLLDVFD